MLDVTAKLSRRTTARVAGLVYLLLAITGAFSTFVVPPRLVVAGEPAATVENIMASEFLFRASIGTALISHVVFLLLALTLYALFKDVSKSYASLMVALVVVAVSVAYLNTLNQLATLQLLSGADYLSAFDPDELNALVMVFLDLHEGGETITSLFWGLWLLPLGILSYKSGFIPRILGVLLVIGCFGYVIPLFVVLLFPGLESVADLGTAVASVGEFSMIVWLLVKGTTSGQVETPAAS